MSDGSSAKRGEPQSERRAELDDGLGRSLARFFRRRVADHAEIDDLVQEVFLRLVRRGGFHGVDHRDGYVFETASSVLADRVRRRRVRHADAHDPIDGDDHGSEEISPERVLLGRERLSAATAALLELPERTRNIFVLRRIEGMKHKDIAVRLGISVSAVEKHMARAIEHLMDRLSCE